MTAAPRRRTTFATSKGPQRGKRSSATSNKGSSGGGGLFTLFIIGAAGLVVAWPYMLVKKATHGNTALAAIAEIIYLAALVAIIVWCVRAYSKWKVQRDFQIEQEARERQRQRDEEYVRSGMAAVDLMSGVEFEKYVAAKLRQDGWIVSLTSVTGDYGVDVIAKKEGRSVAVQCKRQGKPVGIQAVQQVVAGAMHYKCTSSAVVSNRDFTTAAQRLALTHNCRLVGRSALPTWTL